MRLCRFAVTGSADCTARVWDLDATSAHTQGTHTGRVSGLVINADTAITYGGSVYPVSFSAYWNTFLADIPNRWFSACSCHSWLDKISLQHSGSVSSREANALCLGQLFGVTG